MHFGGSLDFLYCIYNHIKLQTVENSSLLMVQYCCIFLLHKPKIKIYWSTFKRFSWPCKYWLVIVIVIIFWPIKRNIVSDDWALQRNTANDGWPIQRNMFSDCWPFQRNIKSNFWPFQWSNMSDCWSSKRNSLWNCMSSTSSAKNVAFDKSICFAYMNHRDQQLIFHSLCHVSMHFLHLCM